MKANCKWCLKYNGAFKNLVKHVQAKHPTVETTGFNRSNHRARPDQLEPDVPPPAQPQVLDEESAKDIEEVKEELPEPMEAYVKLLVKEDTILGPHDDTSLFCRLNQLLSKLQDKDDL